MFSWVPLVPCVATFQLSSPLLASTTLAIALPTGANAPPSGAVPTVMNCRPPPLASSDVSRASQPANSTQPRMATKDVRQVLQLEPA